MREQARHFLTLSLSEAFYTVSFGLFTRFRTVYAVSFVLCCLFHIMLSLSDCLRAFGMFTLSPMDFLSVLMRFLTLDAALSDAISFGGC